MNAKPAAHLPSRDGFTLIELMIVMAIIAILAAIGYPSYQETVARSKRSDAKAVLLETVQWIERQYTVSGRYDQLGNGNALNTAALPYAIAPKGSGATAAYNISFTAAPTVNAFTLQAVPTGSMASDKCGTFTLTGVGVQALSGASATVAECWQR